MRKKFSPSEFVLFAIDASNRPELTKEYLKEINSDYAMLMDDQKVGREKYEIPGTPVTVIIDKKGRAVFRHVGYREGDEATFEKEVRILLERK